MAVTCLLFAGILSAAVLLSVPSGNNAQCLTDNDGQRNNLSVESLLNGSTTFGLELFAQLVKTSTTGGSDQNNILFSPFSVWSALIMAQMGARGNTATELANVLGLGDPRQATASLADLGRANKAVKFWYALRAASNSNYTLHLANRVFVDKTLQTRECILQYFTGELERIDFRRNPEGARQTINRWVEQQTKNKIRDLLPGGSVDGSTSLVLVNAAYFKGLWESQFKPENTQKMPFHLADGNQVMIDMMTQKGWFYNGFNKDLNCQVLEMQYVGEEISMIFLLPTAGTDIESFASKMTSPILRKMRHMLWQHEVEVAIPKFRLEDNFELAPTLKALGINDLFDPIRGDLSGFVEPASSTKPEQRLAVGSVRHKAFLEVNEEGSEAAAATGALAWRSARPAEKEQFIADRAFVILIHDNLSNVILFLGAVRRPDASKNEI